MISYIKTWSQLTISLTFEDRKSELALLMHQRYDIANIYA